MRRALLLISLLLSSLFAEVTVTLYPTVATATWTIYNVTTVNGVPSTYALVREGVCTPIGLRGILVLNDRTVTINMGNVVAYGTEAEPSPQYVTTINVDPDDVRYLESVVPLVWCTNIRVTTYSLVPVTTTISGGYITTVPIYYTVTENYLVPSLTFISQGPDLIVPTITLSPVIITRLQTQYTTITAQNVQTLVTTGLVSVGSTQYPYGMLQWKPTYIQAKIPTTVTLYNNMANVKVSVGLTTTTVNMESSNNVIQTTSKVPSISLLAPLLASLVKRKNRRKKR